VADQQSEVNRTVDLVENDRGIEIGSHVSGGLGRFQDGDAAPPAGLQPAFADRSCQFRVTLRFADEASEDRTDGRVPEQRQHCT
jgi:hypothetical protein